MRRALLAIVVIATLVPLSGCVALPVVVAGGALIPHASPTRIQPPSQTQQQQQQPERYSDGSVSVRGNIPKLVGEKAGMLDGDVRTVTFTVTRLVPDPTCSNADAAAAGSNHYLEVDLHVVTTPNLGADGSGDTVTFDAANWYSYVGDDALPVSATDAVDDCELSTSPLPDRIGPSQDVSGSILLDVGNGTTYLAYQSECGCNTWEWPAPMLSAGARS